MVSLTSNHWDGIRPYTCTQQLIEVPLAAIVGLSEDEQLTAAHRNAHAYLWRAAIGSGLPTSLITRFIMTSRRCLKISNRIHPPRPIQANRRYPRPGFDMTVLIHIADRPAHAQAERTGQLELGIESGLLEGLGPLTYVRQWWAAISALGIKQKAS